MEYPCLTSAAEGEERNGNSPDLERDKAEALAVLDRYESNVIALTRSLVAAPSPNLPGDETAPAQVIPVSAP